MILIYCFFYRNKYIFQDVYEVQGKMTNEQLLEKIKALLKADHDLKFLLSLKKEDLETLIACVRDRIDQLNN